MWSTALRRRPSCAPDAVAPAGTIHVHVSITGYGNFSDDFVEVTYYNDVTLGNDRNTDDGVGGGAAVRAGVGAVGRWRRAPTAPPPTQVPTPVLSYEGFPSIGAGAGVDVPAIGTWATHVPPAVPGELGCVIVPMLAPAGTEVAGESTAAGLGNPEMARHIVPATFVDYTRVLCNVSAGLYAGGAVVGDRGRLALNAESNQAGAWKQTDELPQAGGIATRRIHVYDPAVGASVLDEGATGEQPGFVGRAYGESDATLMAAADRGGGGGGGGGGGRRSDSPSSAGRATR